MNPNTQAYWDAVYANEAGKVRVDAVRLGQLERWVRVREGEVQRPARVFDFGCGRGDALFGLWSMGRERALLGVDRSAVAVEAAVAERYSLGAHDALFMRGDETLLPRLAYGDDVAPGRRFDVAWCGETLEHLDYPTSTVDALAGLLDRGGFLVISTPFKTRNVSPEHVHEFGPADVCAWAARVGELVFLDCLLLPDWLTMFAVMRKGMHS